MIGRFTIAGAGALCGAVLGTGLSVISTPHGTPGASELVSDAHGALAEICIHYREDFAPYGLDVYTDFLGALPPDVRVHVLVEDLPDFAALRNALADRAVPDLERLSPIATGFPISAWAKDRFGTLRRGSRPVIAVPPARSMTGSARGNDERIPELLYERLPGIEREVLPFNFEGGDLLSDEEHVFVAANFLSRNEPLCSQNREKLLERIGMCFGRKVVSIGTEAGDVPDHHIGMYLTPLGSNVVAAADPDLGLQILGRVSETIADVETDPKRYVPFSNVIEHLQDRGFTVVRVPMVLTKTPRVYMTYNNAVCERVGGSRRIYMPAYGIPELDLAATAVFESRGWEVHPIRVEKVFRCTGSLRCLVGVLRRRG